MFDRALRILAHLRGGNPPADPGAPTVLDGAGAVRALEGPTVPLAEALGASSAGVRVAASLDDPRLLDEAARRLLPVVAHGTVPPEATRAFVLVPSTVQEVADLALVARRTAELALVPGVLAHDLQRVTQDLHLPALAFVGEAGDRIPAPTPAQRMLFGEERRRVPRRFDAAHPVLTGATAGHLERAAHDYAFDEPLAALLDESVAALAERTGRRHDLVFAEGDLDAEVVLVAMGSVLGPLRAVAAHLRGAGILKVGVVGVRCLRPFPADRVARLLKGHRTVAVLGEALQRLLPGHLPVHLHPPLRDADLVALVSRLADGPKGPLHLGVDLVPSDRRGPDQEVLRGQMLRAWPGLDARGVRSWPNGKDFRPHGALTVIVQRRSGGPGEGLAAQAARALHETLGGSVSARAESSLEPYGARLRDRLTWAPTPLQTDDGQADVLVLADPSCERPEVREGGVVLVLPGIAPPAVKARVLTVPEARLLEALVALARGQEPPGEPAAPATATRPREEVPRVARNPEAARFYRQEALPALRGEALAADPWKALGEIPPLTAAFRDLAPLRATLPVFDPAACDGCGACWPACPEGALAPLAFTPESLLEAGMTPETAGLRPAAAKLTSRMTLDLLGGDPPRTAGELLTRAYGPVAPTLKADRREPADRALTAVADRLRVLPLAVLEAPVWQGARTMSIVLDPDACKACGACVTACAPGALSMQPQDPVRVEAARRLHRLWQDLPDAQEPLPGLAGLYMDRRRLLAMAGADGAEPGSGAKLALRAVLAVAAGAWTPPDAGALRERLDQALRTLLVEGLEVGEDGSVDETALDREHLARLVGLGRALQDLEASGPGLALAEGVAWPTNPFSLPVYAGASVSAAMGLAEARLREGPADLLRRAHEFLGEEAPPVSPAPLLLVGPEATLAADPALLRALASRLPLKVVALADPGTACPDTALLARALGTPCVLQSTPAYPEHLLAGLEEAFRTPGPALLRLHAPSPSRDGFPADRALQRSREAVEARVFPLWRWTPEGGLDLSGNPPEAGTPEEWSAGESRSPSVSRRTWDSLQPAEPPPPPPPPVPGPEEPDLDGLRAALEEEITERVRMRLLALAGYQE